MACAGSTELVETTTSFDPKLGYELDPAVSLRREPFGALSYHYGNRRLNFLRSSELTDLVESLSEHSSVEAAMDALEIPAPRRPPLEVALGRLLSNEVIRAR